MQYYSDDEQAVYYPDLWTLVEKIGASNISGSVNRTIADQAAQRGIKCMFVYTSPAVDPQSMPDYFYSKEALIEHLSLYNISQYRNHPGVYGHILTTEPFNGYDFDPLNPDQTTLNLIDVLRAGVAYIKQQDPTHPVWVALDPAGAFQEDSNGVYLQKRIAWIDRFDFCDVLDYHYYGNGNSGSEWWRNPDQFRAHLIEMLDDVIIPSAKGRPIIIGEMGCKSSPSIDYAGNPTFWSEELQSEYYRIYGEETTSRHIFVYAYKLLDAYVWSGDDWGLFNNENDGLTNIPKMAAPLVRQYLSIP